MRGRVGEGAAPRASAVSYTLQFGQVVGYIPDLLRGALISLELAFLGFVIGFAIGLFNASVLHFGRGWVTWPSKAYVPFSLGYSSH